MASKKVQENLEIVSKQLVKIPEDMRIFSLSMRSLFTEYAVGTSSDTAKIFRKLRDDTRKDAVLYVAGVLPAVKQCISNIKGYFEYYHDLTMDQWWEGIEDIIEETKAHKETCNAVITINEGIIIKLNKRKDEAKYLIDELKDLSDEYEKTAKEIEDRLNASTFTDEELNCEVVKPSALVKGEEESALAEAVAKRKEAEIQIGAAEVVRDKLSPALSNFITGLSEVAGFLELMHTELQFLFSKGGESTEMDQQRRLHFNTLRSKSSQIMDASNGFFAVLPSIRSDLEAIPTEGTDKNYVDRWLEKQKKNIMDKSFHNHLVNKIMKNITSGIK